MKIPPLAPTTLAQATPDEAATKRAAVAGAAKQFEAILLKQLLSSAHVLGKKQDGYAGMALDALASGIASGGGIGLARAIENAVQHAEITDQTTKPPTKA